MTIPPKKRPVNDDLVQTKVRLPRKLYDELQAEASSKGLTLTAEILERLQLHQHRQVLDRLASLEALVRRMNDRT